MAPLNPHLSAAQLIREAGGELVGRTRLQKVAYLTQLAGFGGDFSFDYYHFGPFSEDLARGMEIASAFQIITEDERRADWGGRYSVYTAEADAASASSPRALFIQRAAKIGSIELELAATAAFLAREGHTDPWGETRRRKPDKAMYGRLERAKSEYDRLRQDISGTSLPSLPDIKAQA